MESLESLNSKEFQRNLADDDCVELELPLSLIQHLTSEDCDLQLLCRVCLSTNNPQLFPLYFSKEDEPLPEMFTSFTAISVHADEGLPAQICESCRAQVVDCYEFKMKCLKADYTLRSLLKGEFEAKVNPNENIVISSEAAQNYAVKSEICEIKEEDYLNEDVQYLEDLSDIASEKDSLIVKRITKRNRKKIHSVLDPVYVEQDLPKSKKRSVNSKSDKKSKPHVCHFCAKRFFSPTALKSHVDRIHGSADDPNACRQCKESFASEHDLKVHSVIHDEGPMWKCNKCDKEFTERGPLRRHVQRHMECKRHTCASCGKAFAELYALRRHTRVHTGERAEKRHACNLCDKLFSESSLLTVHLARHRGDRPCICATCGKSFPSARLLQSHHLVHSEHKPHACRYCDKRFRHESTRNTHHRTHTGERPYVCSVCGKTFIQNSNLTLHMRTHTGEKPYTCDTCGRKFTSSSTLKSHARSHTGERPYGCAVCGKRFARMDLSAHMSLHTGERPYACGVCERKFARAAGLREHSRVHTGERPFECAMCQQKFATTSHLSKHAKSHQTKKKKKAKQDVILLQQVDEPYILTENYLLAKNDVKTNNTEELKTVETYDNEYDKEITVDTEPLEVTEEIVVQDDSDVKSDFLVVDDTQSSNYQNETLCLSTNGVNYVNDVNYANDVNLVTVNEGEVSISSASSVHEGTTVKLYQLDQSLVQIHSVGGQVTISKITSKMTANF